MTLTLVWQPPQNNGGAAVDSYTITVSPGYVPLTTSVTSAVFTLPYNVIHTVSIEATNICGSSNATMETIPAIGMARLFELYYQPLRFPVGMY